MANIFTGLIIFTAGILLLSSLVGLALYLLRATGVYKLAKGLGLNNPWLAFVPVANSYIYGKVADEASGGGNSRKLLLGLKCVPFVTFVIQAVVSISLIALLPGAFEIVKEAFSAGSPEDMDVIMDQLSTYFNGNSGAALALMLLPMLNWINSIASFAYGIAFAFTSNKLFSAYGSSNPLLISIIGFFFEIVYDIYIFMIRNNTPERLRTQE